MTNKEAIAILNHNWKYRELIDNSYQYEALKLAIKALETLEGVTLTRNIDAMEDDAKQASIPYSYQMPKDYIKNKLDYSRPQGKLGEKE